jgi:hypothetical protein
MKHACFTGNKKKKKQTIEPDLDLCLLYTSSLRCFLWVGPTWPPMNHVLYIAMWAFFINRTCLTQIGGIRKKVTCGQAAPSDSACAIDSKLI